jgi:hypothetical protein
VLGRRHKGARLSVCSTRVCHAVVSRALCARRGALVGQSLSEIRVPISPGVLGPACGCGDSIGSRCDRTAAGNSGEADDGGVATAAAIGSIRPPFLAPLAQRY